MPEGFREGSEALLRHYNENILEHLHRNFKDRVLVSGGRRGCMKRYRRGILLLAVCCLAAAGCRKKDDTADVEVYYLNTEGTALTTEGYNWKSAKPGEQVDEVLKKLRKPQDAVKCTSAIPADVLIMDYQLEGNCLELYFSQEYGLLDKPSEVLLRAAVVESLAQVDTVSLVCFYVNGEPLKDSHGVEVGYMRSDDFVQNTGTALNSYQQEEVTLYYSDETGNSLEKTRVSLRYNSYMTKEKAIVEQLIKEPEEEGKRAVIPAETKLLGVSIKDNICYVNLNEGFLADIPSIKPELKVYALVNSVIGGGNCRQVQISINGDTEIALEGGISLEKPFQENKTIVEE